VEMQKSADVSSRGFFATVISSFSVGGRRDGRENQDDSGVGFSAATGVVRKVLVAALRVIIPLVLRKVLVFSIATAASMVPVGICMVVYSDVW
jgi:hypothetical protein